MPTTGGAPKPAPRPRPPLRPAAWLALPLLLLLPAATAEAQYTRTAPAKTRFRLGPLHLSPKLELRNAGRDTNVNNSGTNALGDDSVTLRASTDAFTTLGSRIRLSGNGWLDWSYYRREETQSSSDPGADGRAEVDVGPVTLIGGGGGFQARQLYSIDIDERILREERFGYAGADWRLTRKLSLSGGAEMRTYRYDPSRRTATYIVGTADRLNRDSLAGQLAARWRLTGRTTAVASADVIEDEFSASLSALRTTRSYRYLGGFEFGEKALLQGRLMVGLRDFPASSSGSLPSYRGLALQAGLVLPVGTRARLSGAFSRDVQVSAIPLATTTERGRNAFVQENFQVSADVALPLSFIARPSAGLVRADYLIDSLENGRLVPRADHLYTVGGTLLRAVTDNLRVGGTVSYFRRVSTISGASYDRWTYGLSAELVP